MQRDDVGLVSQIVNSAFQCTVASGLSGEGLVTFSHAREKTVTVSASIPSVPAYEAYGFKIVGPNEEKQGLRYVPMEIELNE